VPGKKREGGREGRVHVCAFVRAFENLYFHLTLPSLPHSLPPPSRPGKSTAASSVPSQSTSLGSSAWTFDMLLLVCSPTRRKI